MLLYEKKIGYLSLYQDGERKSSVGFLRISRERNACRMEIHIKKNAGVYSGNYGLYLVLKDREQPWGHVTIRKEDEFAEKLLLVRGNMFCLEGERIREDDVCGISVKLEDGRWISGRWKEADKGTGGSWRERQESDGKADNSQGKKQELYEKAGSFRGERRETQQKADWAKEIEKDPENQNLHAAGIHLSEDKWGQLQKRYRTIHPFGDDRAFISIELRDFQLLKPPYQRLANNSFLLHGFYNYRHLILGPDKELGGNNGFCFYLGVPGTYFEREKMVAVMFGFEGFESSGAVEIGKFGYYMRRVEI